MPPELFAGTLECTPLLLRPSLPYQQCCKGQAGEAAKQREQVEVTVQAGVDH